MKNYFFDIPVYRLTKEKYYTERDAYIQKSMYPTPLHMQFLERNPEDKERYQQYLEDKYGGAWNYNEIIGWVQLYILGRQIRGEFWRVKAKRLVRSRNKIFKWQTFKLVPEIDIPYDAKNDEIFRLIEEYLLNCRKALKGLYLDVHKIHIIGPYIDWCSLIQQLSLSKVK